MVSWCSLLYNFFFFIRLLWLCVLLRLPFFHQENSAFLHYFVLQANVAYISCTYLYINTKFSATALLVVDSFALCVCIHCHSCVGSSSCRCCFVFFLLLSSSSISRSHFSISFHLQLAFFLPHSLERCVSVFLCTFAWLLLNHFGDYYFIFYVHRQCEFMCFTVKYIHRKKKSCVRFFLCCRFSSIRLLLLSFQWTYLAIYYLKLPMLILLFICLCVCVLLFFVARERARMGERKSMFGTGIRLWRYKYAVVISPWMPVYHPFSV